MNKNKRQGDFRLHRRGRNQLIGKLKKRHASLVTGVDSQIITRDLKSCQIQLELRNKELTQSLAEVEAVLRQYSDLYDFAPVGYFTLSRDGIIRQTNQIGAHLLGVEYGELIKRGFEMFVSEKSNAIFKAFFERLLSGEGRETCELEFIKNEQEALWAKMEATCFEGGDETRVMLTDITERRMAEYALHESESRYRELIELAVDGILVGSHEGIIIAANSYMLSLTGRTLDELIGTYIGSLFSARDLEEHPLRFDLLHNGETVINMRDIVRPDGSIVSIEMHTKMMPNGTYQSIYRDVTERKRTEDALKKSEEQYRTLIELASDGIFLANSDGNYIEVNSAGCQLLNYTRAEILQLTMREIVRPIPNRTEILKELRDGKAFLVECDMIRKDGIPVPVEINSRQLPDGRFLGIVRDITGRRHAEEKLRHANESLEAAHQKLRQSLAYEQQLARTDSLTGISNRHHFFEFASHAFSAAARYHRPLSIIMFDVDHLKQVNDTFGHAAGDTMLMQIAHAASEEMRSVDVLARYGGDEFIILLPETNAKQARFIADRICASARLFSITLSVGIAEFQNDPLDENVEIIIRHADKALYEAKANGRNCIVIYSPFMEART